MYPKISKIGLLVFSGLAALAAIAVLIPYDVIHSTAKVVLIVIGIIVLARRNVFFDFLEEIKKSHKFQYDKNLDDLIKHLTITLSVPVDVGYSNINGMNAFAAYDPFRKRGMIAFTRELELSATENQIIALAGHEIAHIKNGDAKNKYFIIAFERVVTFYTEGAMVFFKSMARGSSGKIFIVALFVMAILSILTGSYDTLRIFWFSIYHIPLFRYLAIFALLNWLLQNILMYFHHSYSRTREFLADQDGAAMTSTHDLISALALLESQYEPRPASVFDTHPSTEERIARLSWSP